MLKSAFLSFGYTVYFIVKVPIRYQKRHFLLLLYRAHFQLYPPKNEIQLGERLLSLILGIWELMDGIFLRAKKPCGGGFYSSSDCAVLINPDSFSSISSGDGNRSLYSFGSVSVSV